MTVPAALPSPGATPTGLPGLPAADGTEEQAAADAFAALLAALGGGVVVPVPGALPLQPASPGTTEPTALTGAPGTAGAAEVPVTAVTGAVAVQTPVVWEATTQRAHVPVDALAPAPATSSPAAPVAPAASASPAAPEAPPAAGAPATPTPSGAASGAPTEPGAVAEPQGEQLVQLPSDGLTTTPPQAAAAAAAQLQPAAGAVAETATRSEPVSSSHRVQPALLEAARGLRDEGGGRTSLVVRLDPPELGAVVVRLTVQDGRVDVQLRTPDVTARGDLQAQAFDVQRVLRDNGFDLTSFDVAQGGAGGGAQGDLAAGGREDARTPDRGTPQRDGAADGRPGTSHVTDDGNDPQAAGTWL